MAANPVLLCIHRDPDRMRVLKENGYELLTAATGQEALGVLDHALSTRSCLSTTTKASSMARQSPARLDKFGPIYQLLCWLNRRK